MGILSPNATVNDGFLSIAQRIENAIEELFSEQDVEFTESGAFSR